MAAGGGIGVRFHSDFAPIRVFFVILEDKRYANHVEIIEGFLRARPISHSPGDYHLGSFNGSPIRFTAFTTHSSNDLVGILFFPFPAKDHPCTCLVRVGQTLPGLPAGIVIYLSLLSWRNRLNCVDFRLARDC